MFVISNVYCEAHEYKLCNVKLCLFMHEVRYIKRSCLELLQFKFVHSDSNKKSGELPVHLDYKQKL